MSRHATILLSLGMETSQDFRFLASWLVFHKAMWLSPAVRKQAPLLVIDWMQVASPWTPRDT